MFIWVSINIFYDLVKEIIVLIVQTSSKKSQFMKEDSQIKLYKFLNKLKNETNNQKVQIV